MTYKFYMENTCTKFIITHIERNKKLQIGIICNFL